MITAILNKKQKFRQLKMPLKDKCLALNNASASKTAQVLNFFFRFKKIKETNKQCLTVYHEIFQEKTNMLLELFL